MASQGQQGSSSGGYYYGNSSGQGQQQQQTSQQQQEPEWRCLKCGRFISSIRAEAEEHNRTCNGQCIWVCKYCRAEFEDSKEAEQHVYNHWNVLRANNSTTHGQGSWGS